MTSAGRQEFQLGFLWAPRMAAWLESSLVRKWVDLMVEISVVDLADQRVAPKADWSDKRLAVHLANLLVFQLAQQ